VSGFSFPLFQSLSPASSAFSSSSVSSVVRGGGGAPWVTCFLLCGLLWLTREWRRTPLFLLEETGAQILLPSVQSPSPVLFLFFFFLVLLFFLLSPPRFCPSFYCAFSLSDSSPPALSHLLWLYSQRIPTIWNGFKGITARNGSWGRRRRRRWAASQNGVVCAMGMTIFNLVTEVLKSCNQALL